jgi:hypothetical protein
MLLLEGYISNFTCARYYFLYVLFSSIYVNQSLAGQTLPVKSPISIEKMKPSCCARDSPNSKVVRHNMKACKNSGFADIYCKKNYLSYKLIDLVQYTPHFY